MKNNTLFILTGGAIGILAPVLVSLGNPANMGVCAACFLRDTAGALGLHSIAPLSYVRPEILGLIMGGLLSSLFWSKDFSLQKSSNLIATFMLGLFAMLGALVFLGCPWRMLLRLGGGDMSALAGLLGLVAGVAVGFNSKRLGFSLQASQENNAPNTKHKWLVALAIFVVIAGLLVLSFTSQNSPNIKHAPFWLSLGCAIIIGALVQRSKFCTTGAIAGIFRKEWGMGLGVLSAVIFASLTNLMLSQYHFGFSLQPIAHNDYAYNFFAMMLSGLCFSLASGCAGKHLCQLGAGKMQSGVFVLGMLIGAGVAHNFSISASPKGVGANSATALAIGFVFCIILIAINIRKKARI